MIFIDAGEGLSGDMLLAAMLGLLENDRRKDIFDRMVKAAAEDGLEFRLLEVEERDEKGLAVTYLSKEQLPQEISYEEAFSKLERIQDTLRTDSEVARRILALIFEAEGEAHGKPPKEIHLHEIGRPQALLNIAEIGLLHSELTSAGAGGFACSTITTGKGIVVVSHGAIRVPAPASKSLLKGMKHMEGDAPGERATPTGIAAVKAIIRTQFDTVPEGVIKRSIGFGTKRFGGRLGKTVLIWTR